MAIEVEIDVELLKSEIKKTYSSVSEQPQTEFIFPTGRAWAEDLDYPEELANVPEAAVESFAGVANPWTMGRLAPGERALDLGSRRGHGLADRRPNGRANRPRDRHRHDTRDARQSACG